MPIVPIEEINLLHTNVCQAISEPKRIQILLALSENPMRVNELAAALDTPQSTISRHLSMLRQRGIVLAERDGTSVEYRLTDERIIKILNVMREILRDLLEQQSGVLD